MSEEKKKLSTASLVVLIAKRVEERCGLRHKEAVLIVKEVFSAFQEIAVQNIFVPIPYLGSIIVKTREVSNWKRYSRKLKKMLTGPSKFVMFRFKPNVISRIQFRVRATGASTHMNLANNFEVKKDETSI